MKSILYVGATLMIGASIYGFVDYKKTSHKKEFSGMYTEERKKEPVKVIVNDKTAVNSKTTTPEKSNTVVARKKPAIKKENPVVIKPIAEEEKMVTAKTTLPEKEAVTLAPSKESSLSKTVKKKRKFSTKIFSRAPLREEEEITVVPSKKEIKKSENKEQ